MSKIVIDGNIGSGKSTQLKLLQYHTSRQIYPERIDTWPLQNFYDDPSHYALDLQVAVMKSMAHRGGGIYERCPMTARDVFWNILLQDGTHQPCDPEQFVEKYSQHGWEPDLFIFIDTPPSVCLDRIHNGKRSQPGDETITLEYLDRLNRQYKYLWENISCPKIKIDGTMESSAIQNAILSHINVYASAEM